MLSLYKLEVFIAVIETGSFSAAAERLFMTQPAVSQHIHDLEASFGVRLFQRGPRGVRPTPQGHILYEYAGRILELLAEAENALTDVERLESGQVAIAATPGVSAYRLPDWVQSFRALYPRLTVSLQTGITSQVVAEVLASRVDAGFVEGELDEYQHPRLGTLVLEEVEQLVVVGQSHPWRDRQQVALAELAGQTLIMRPPGSHSRTWLDRVLAQHGVRPIVGAEFDNQESIKRALANGACLAVLPYYVVRSEAELGSLRALRVVDAPLRRTLKLLWNRSRPFTPIARAFLRHLADTFPQLATLRGAAEKYPLKSGG